MKKHSRGQRDGEFSGPGVRVVPFEDGWTTLFHGGYFAFPSTREDAVRKAMEIAGGANLKRICIMDADGAVEGAMSLDGDGVWTDEEEEREV